MNAGEQGMRGPGVVGKEAETATKKAGGDDTRAVMVYDKKDHKKRKDASSDSQEGSQDGEQEAHWYHVFTRPGQMRTIAKYCPLMAAILAPLATLLDIPALTQHWYSLNGNALPDPTVSLVLSAVGLILNVFANGLLIMRFSSTKYWWVRVATVSSLLGWWAKTAVAAVNLIIFGATARNGAGYSYSAGFWCAVVSLTDAVFISFALLFHFLLAFGREKQQDTAEVRREGQKFMLSVTFFLVILGFQALAYNRMEGWAYSDAIYFSVQTSLTIGYGDFAPTTTAGKVLIFPFSVLTISQLGNEIALIIGFIGQRTNERRDRWRTRYEGAMHREAQALRPKAGLIEEMALIHQINQKEEMMSQLYDLFWSALSLILFWAVGATMFSQVEGWGFGNAVYAVMILSLTIGFGDYTPATDAGRVLFIPYALMAVPIVTSFAVQTITGLLSTFSERNGYKARFLRERDRQPDAFKPHAHFIQRAHESYGDERKRWMAEEAGMGDQPEPKQDENHDDPPATPSATETAGDSSESNDGARKTKRDSGGPKTNSGTASRRSDGKRTSSPSDQENAKPVEPTPTDSSGDTAIEGSDASRAGASSSDLDDEKPGRKKEASKLGAAEDKIEDDYGRMRQVFGKQRKRRAEMDADESETGQEHDQEREDMHDEKEEHEQELWVDLLKQLMNRTIQLEAEARQMLLDSMEKGIARTVLLADRNVQIRDVRALRGDDANMLAIWRGEQEKTDKDRERSAQVANPESTDMLDRVRRYRNTFAEILVIGSALQKLHGEEMNQFERWRDKAEGDGDQEVLKRGEGLDDVADQQYDGLSGRIFKHHAKKLRERDFSELAGKAEQNRPEKTR